MNVFQAQRQFLNDALNKNRLSHSYIFSGTEDLQFAKAIAKMILCKQEHTGCDSCSSCLKVNSENHPDLNVVSPDGASIKNAQVEELQEYMFIRPYESKHKIAIIHQSHLMTESAQNRLLKILEEPPEYAVFIFLTQNLEGMLETLQSRCQVLGFNLEGESETDDSPEITDKAVDFIQSIENRDLGRILEFSAYAKQDKQRFVLFLNRVIIILRDLMIYRETQNKRLIHEVNFSILEERGQLMKSSGKLSRKQMVELILTIDHVEQKIKNNMNFDLTVDNLLFRCIED